MVNGFLIALHLRDVCITTFIQLINSSNDFIVLCLLLTLLSLEIKTNRRKKNYSLDSYSRDSVLSLESPLKVDSFITLSIGQFDENKMFLC